MPGWDDDLAASIAHHDPTVFAEPPGPINAACEGFPDHKPSVDGTARAASSHQAAGMHDDAAGNLRIAAVNFLEPSAGGILKPEMAGQPVEEADEEELQQMLSLLCT